MGAGGFLVAAGRPTNIQNKVNPFVWRRYTIFSFFFPFTSPNGIFIPLCWAAWICRSKHKSNYWDDGSKRERVRVRVWAVVIRHCYQTFVIGEELPIRQITVDLFVNLLSSSVCNHSQNPISFAKHFFFFFIHLAHLFYVELTRSNRLQSFQSISIYLSLSSCCKIIICQLTHKTHWRLNRISCHSRAISFRNLDSFLSPHSPCVLNTLYCCCFNCCVCVCVVPHLKWLYVRVCSCFVHQFFLLWFWVTALQKEIIPLITFIKSDMHWNQKQTESERERERQSDWFDVFPYECCFTQQQRQWRTRCGWQGQMKQQQSLIAF